MFAWETCYLRISHVRTHSDSHAHLDVLAACVDMHIYMHTDGNLAADGQHVEILRNGPMESSRPGMPTASRFHSGGLHRPSGLQSLIGTQLGRNVPALQIASDTPRGMCRGHLRVPGPLPHSRRLDGGRLCRGGVCGAGGVGVTGRRRRRRLPASSGLWQPSWPRQRASLPRRWWCAAAPSLHNGGLFLSRRA